MSACYCSALAVGAPWSAPAETGADRVPQANHTFIGDIGESSGPYRNYRPQMNGASWKL